MERTGQPSALAGHVWNTIDNPIGFAILCAGNPITFAGMKNAVSVDSSTASQYAPTTARLITQTDVMPYNHCAFLRHCASYPCANSHPCGFFDYL
jgi:hypothetical protein